MSSTWCPPDMKFRIEARNFTQSRSPLSAIKPRSESCSDGCSSGSFSHLHTGRLELSHSDHWVLVTLPTKALLPRLAALALRPALGSWLYQTSSIEELYILSQICALTQSCLLSSADSSFNLKARFLLLYSSSAVRPHIHSVCFSKSCPVS